MEKFAETILSAGGVAPGGVAGENGNGAALRLHPPWALRSEADVNAIGDEEQDAGLKNPERQENFPEEAALHCGTLTARA